MGAEPPGRSATDRIASGCVWLLAGAWTLFWLFVFLLGVGMSGEICYALPEAEQDACKSSQALMAGAFAIGVWAVPFTLYGIGIFVARLGRRLRAKRPG